VPQLPSIDPVVPELMLMLVLPPLPRWCLVLAFPLSWALVLARVRAWALAQQLPQALAWALVLLGAPVVQLLP
jgi:hypothetical protein